MGDALAVHGAPAPSLLDDGPDADLRNDVAELVAGTPPQSQATGGVHFGRLARDVVVAGRARAMGNAAEYSTFA